MKRFIPAVALLVLLCPFLLQAQEVDFPRAEVTGRYNFTRADLGEGYHVNCHGLAGDAAFNVTSWFGVVGDFSWCRGGFAEDLIAALGYSGLVEAHLSALTFMGGPRFSFRSASAVTPYFHFLVGIANAQATVNTTSTGSLLAGGGISVNQGENGFAFGPGGGVDVRVSEHVGIRAVQFDYLGTRLGGETQNNIRLQSGVVFRF